jgi:membrane protease YdiL (CAAX protease family)
LAVLVFPLELFWGWFYARYPTLMGVAALHILIGSFGLFVVGFPTKGAA